VVESKAILFLPDASINTEVLDSNEKGYSIANLQSSLNQRECYENGPVSVFHTYGQRNSFCSHYSSTPSASAETPTRTAKLSA
jgi:hypothetical protein